MHPLVCLVLLALPAFALDAMEPAAPRAIHYPAQAPILDVRDFGAVGDGVTDDTAAVQAAFDEALRRKADADQRSKALREALFYQRHDEAAALASQPITCNQTIWFPAGTYLLSAPVHFGDDPYQANSLQLVGEHRDRVVLKLADGSPAFADPREPRALVSFFEGHAQKNWGDGTNIAMQNVCENLTIDVGSGNPGAIGLDYIDNNAGYVRDVVIRSSDPEGAGAIGLKLTRRLGGIGLIADLRIEGFDVGIATGGGKICYTFERIALRDQREVGIDNADKLIQVRHLTSDNAVPAIRNHGDECQLVLLESRLQGGAPEIEAIDHRGGSLFLRDVHAGGYAATLRLGDETVAGGSLDELVHPAPVVAWDDAPRSSLRLPIRETPRLPIDPVESWAIVDGSAQADDSAAIQAAIDSGATTVYLPTDCYQIDQTIVIRGAVRRFDAGRSQFFRSRRPAEPSPLFVIGSTDAEMLRIERFTNFMIDDSFASDYFVNRSTRPVILSDMKFIGGKGVTPYRSETTSDLYIEAVSMGGAPAIFAGQRVWARFINPERASPQIVNDGGDLWVFGFKFEAGQPGFVGINGSRTEVLGGLYNMQSGEAAGCWNLCDHSTMTLTGAQDRGNLDTVVRELREGEERQLKLEQVWTPRGGSRGPEFNLALYRSADAVAPAADAPQVSLRVIHDRGGEAGEALRIALHRTGDLTAPLPVHLAVGPHSVATAADILDFPHHVVIPAGAAELELALQPAEDGETEEPEPLRLMLCSSAGYRVDRATRTSPKLFIQDRGLELGRGVEAIYDFRGDPLRDSSGRGNHAASLDGAEAVTEDGIALLRFADGDDSLLIAPWIRAAYREWSGSLSRSYMHRGFASRSVALWLRLPAEPDADRRRLFREGGDQGWWLDLEDGRLVAVASNDRADVATIAVEAPLDGGWHHVALVYVRGDLLLFVDGEQVGSASTDGSSVGSHKAGARLGPAPGIALTDLVVYDRAINAAEVAALAAMAAGALEVPQPPIEPVVDVDFEGEGLPRGWWTNDAAPAMVATADDAGVLRLQTDGTASCAAFTNLTLEPGWTALRFGGRMRLRTLEAAAPEGKGFKTARILLTFRDAEKQNPQYAGAGDLAAAGDWVAIERVVPIPGGTTQVQISPAMLVAGTFELDRLVVTPVTEAQP